MPSQKGKAEVTYFLSTPYVIIQEHPKFLSPKKSGYGMAVTSLLGTLSPLLIPQTIQLNIHRGTVLGSAVATIFSPS